MTFKRLLDGSGNLTDEQLERLLTIAMQDEAVLEAAQKLVQQARAGFMGGAQPDRSLSYDLWRQARWLSLREYPQSEVNDWNEVNRQLEAQLVQRRLSDQPR